MEIIYFELNNWFKGVDYPNAEPFLSWMSNDLRLRFYDEDWIEKNRLCVRSDKIDMSTNFCITAPKEWINKNCPELLAKYKNFLRFPNKNGAVYSRFGPKFLEYTKENIGLFYKVNK